MFIETRNPDAITEQLSKANKSREEVVIHYSCLNCGDEQVTDFIEIDDNMLSQWIKGQEIVVSYECTSCAVRTLYLNLDNINGFETE